MASRKRPPESMSLFAPVNIPPKLFEGVNREVDPPRLATMKPAPKLELVHSQQEDEVSVEPCDDGRYLVSLVRPHGASVAGVFYTRKQLEMLLRRIPGALAMGGK